jgi:hypothetical protein
MAILAEPSVHTDRAVKSYETKPSATQKLTSNGHSVGINIIDIRSDRDRVQTTLKEDILSMLQPEHGARQMPTLLLYDERGLQLFEDVGLLYT